MKLDDEVKDMKLGTPLCERYFFNTTFVSVQKCSSTEELDGLCVNLKVHHLSTSDLEDAFKDSGVSCFKCVHHSNRKR